MQKEDSTLLSVNKKDQVAAVVNGSEISSNDYIRELYQAERKVIDSGRLLTSVMIKKLENQIMEGLVNQELLYQEAIKTIQVADTDIADDLDKLKDQFKSDVDYKKAVPVLKARLKRTLTIRKYIDTAFTSKITIKDNDIRSYYDNNLSFFRAPEQIKAGYIMVNVDPQWNATQKADAKKKIDSILEKAQAGKNFASLARKYVRKGQILKSLEDALFVLKPGEVSDVIKNNMGYNLIKAIEYKPETTLPFEDVKDQVRNALKLDKGQQEAIKYITKMRENASIKTFLSVEK